MVTEYFILWLIPSEYHGAVTIAPLIILAYSANAYYHLGTKQIFYSKNVKIVPIVTSLSGLINIILNILLIPKYGYVAAAFTTLFSLSFSSILMCYFGQKYCHLHINFTDTFLYLLLLVSIYLCFTFMIINPSFLVVIKLFTILFIILGLYIFDKEFINSSLHNIFKNG